MHGCMGEHTCWRQRFGPLDTLVPFSRMFEDMLVPAAERAGRQVVALRAKRNVDQTNIEEEEVCGGLVVKPPSCMQRY